MRAFLCSGASGGIVLIVAALAAMAIANSPLAPAYFAALAQHVGPLSILHWINDGLMTLFFLLVGLEIKRELVDGHLASWSDRALPAVAALSGMIVPALVYLAVAASTPGLARGWAIPSATDIAFALGVMALLGNRAPPSLKLFLTTVAIVDDMGAVAVIAVAYTSAVSGPALLAAALILGLMFVLNRFGVVRLWPYLMLGLLFSYVFIALDAIDPGHFFTQGEQPTTVYLYFSYITLATIGYGDFTPAHTIGRFAAVAEGLMGQLYLVTVLALIVSNLGRQRKPPTETDG